MPPRQSAALPSTRTGVSHTIGLDDDEDHDNDEKMGRIQKIQSWNSTANMESPAP